jgi:hypothetical protein
MAVDHDNNLKIITELIRESSGFLQKTHGAEIGTCGYKHYRDLGLAGAVLAAATSLGALAAMQHEQLKIMSQIKMVVIHQKGQDNGPDTPAAAD